MNKQWEFRRSLDKCKNKEKIEQWRAEVFDIPQDLGDMGPAGDCSLSFNTSGCPKKRLSDSPGTKTEISILDGILDDIEKKAKDENIAPELLLKKLVDRSMKKWNLNEPKEESKTTVPVQDAFAMIYNNIIE